MAKAVVVQIEKGVTGTVVVGSRAEAEKLYPKGKILGYEAAGAEFEPIESEPPAHRAEADADEPKRGVRKVE